MPIKKWIPPLSLLGVTLLEIMLVLAIAAMIIVMSVRYYQSATTTQAVNATMQQLQGIMAAVDNLVQTGTTYSTIKDSSLKNILPDSTFRTQWGEDITVSPGTNAVDIKMASVPKSICAMLKERLKNNARFDTATDCKTISIKAA